MPLGRCYGSDHLPGRRVRKPQDGVKTDHSNPSAENTTVPGDAPQHPQPALRPLLARTRTLRIQPACASAPSRRQSPTSRGPKAVSLFHSETWGAGETNISTGEIPSPYLVSFVCFELLVEIS